jgi:hypothetical protein
MNQGSQFTIKIILNKLKYNQIQVYKAGKRRALDTAFIESQ